MSKIYEILGLAKRASRIQVGELIFESFKKRQVKLLLVSDKAGANILSKYENKCEYYEVAMLKVEDTLMNQAIGENNKKAVAILDEGFAKLILKHSKG